MVDKKDLHRIKYFDPAAKLSNIALIDQPVFYEGNLRYNPKSMLLKNRIIKLPTEIDEASADYIQDLLLLLDALEYKGKKNQDIMLYINSYGGVVYEGFAIYDTMQHIRSDVVTVCVGKAMSFGSALLMAGAPGKRYALPNSTIMVHQISGGEHGKLSDMVVGIEEAKRLEDRLLDLYVHHVPKDENGYVTRWGGDPYARSVDDIKPEKMSPAEAKEWLRKWAEKDRYMNAEQALAFGHIDAIIKTKDLPHYKLLDEKE